jgi:ribonucleoside-diphosphate reductase alpha chain
MAELSKNGNIVATNRYFHDKENWQGCAERSGFGAASIENGDRSRYADEFSRMIFDLEFLPGGRILRNIGRARGSLFNCYVLPIGDSIEEIGQFMKDALILWSEGGGVGTNLSYLRPRGTPIKGKGGESSGPVSFLEAADAIANTIESGGSRRAAALACMHVNHPDILEFIDTKLVHGKLSHFNLSVGVDNNFLEAVESDSEWKFSFAQQSHGVVQARDIWDKIVNNMVACAEPGLLHWGNLIKNNSYYFDPIISTNPCLVGDTLVAVADGRGNVPIKKLAEEGADVPVYSFNESTKKIEVRMMRNPRLTGYKEKIFKVILDDGSFLKCNEAHTLYMKDGTLKTISELKVGDSLDHMVKYNASFEEVFRRSNSKSQDYSWINNGYQKTVAEHRLIAEFKMGRSLNPDEVIHHLDSNGLNNKPANLSVMLKNEHDELHSRDMFGIKNPMNRFPEKNWLIKQDWFGSKNGRYKGIDPVKVFGEAVKLSKASGRRITYKEWKEYCKENGLPCSRYSIRNASSFSSFLKNTALEADVFIYDNSIIAREYKKFLTLVDNTDLDIFFDNGILVRKECEFCSNTFVVKWNKREQCFCKVSCSNKSRNKKVKSGNSLTNTGANYKVVSIEFCGYEDVYNGTVDNNHNFYVMVNATKTKSGKVKYNHVLNRQCGEVALGSYGSCDLGSIVLPSFISNVNTNWKKLGEIIKLAIRFLDNIIELNKYVLGNIDRNAHNGRRIGLGIMGLAEYLFAKKLRYGSRKAIDETERLMRFIRDASYEASVELAREKGAFPRFDTSAYSKASFVRKLPASLRMDIKKYGIRNVSTMAIAPTGTISLLPEVSSGIEPLFLKAYKRHDRVSERMYVHDIYKNIIDSKEATPEWYVDTSDLKPEDHFEMQAIVQKYVDGAVSKTINMPTNTTPEQLSALMLEYIYDLKGVTIYVDGSREGQILNKVTKKETKEYLAEHSMDAGLHDAYAEFKTAECVTGACEV